MKPDEANAKEKIFQAAMELVIAGKSDQQITSREIASKAGVNLALVNYYYHSKENLLSAVVGTMMGGIIEPIQHGQLDADAQTRLRNILLATADAAFKYRNICQIALSLELKNGCGSSSQMILPLLRELFTGRSESDLNIIALQLMMPFHHIVLNPELYSRYLDTDFYDEQKRRDKINQMIDCIIDGRM